MEGLLFLGDIVLMVGLVYWVWQIDRKENSKEVTGLFAWRISKVTKPRRPQLKNRHKGAV